MLLCVLLDGRRMVVPNLDIILEVEEKSLVLNSRVLYPLQEEREHAGNNCRDNLSLLDPVLLPQL